MSFEKTNAKATLGLPTTDTSESQSIYQRLELLLELKKQRINNASSRKTILRTILTQDDLPILIKKQKARIGSLLQHAWGQRQTGILRSILKKAPEQWDDKEKKIFDDMLGKYLVSQRARKKMIAALRSLW